MKHRANITFCFKLEKTFGGTHKMLQKLYGDNKRTGRRETSNCAELLEKVREIFAFDENFPVRMVGENLNSFTGTIRTIQTSNFGKGKISARFVQLHLNEDQNILVLSILKASLQQLKTTQIF